MAKSRNRKKHKQKAMQRRKKLEAKKNLSMGKLDRMTGLAVMGAIAHSNSK